MESLKKCWRDADVKIPRSPESYEEIVNGRRLTALDNLARRYKRFSNMAIVLILCNAINIVNLGRLSGDYRYAVAWGILLTLFLLTASIMDRWLYYGIRGIDIQTMPVAEVVRKALFYRKRHIQFIFILLPLALALVGMIAWKLNDMYVNLGIIAGFITGVAIGVSKLLDFLADYRTLTRGLPDTRE